MAGQQDRLDHVCRFLAKQLSGTSDLLPFFPHLLTFSPSLAFLVFRSFIQDDLCAILNGHGRVRVGIREQVEGRVSIEMTLRI
jgi:hypothetical protein